jgi:methionine sulfoxide reductase heme-binding subunit
MSNELLWYTGRGTGLMALVLLTVVVVLGILGRSGRSAVGLPRFALADVHRNASLLGLGLVFTHLTVLWLDPFARLRIYDLLIPFDAAYRPFWVGLGTIAMELMVLVIATSLLRKRLGARAWKLVHWASYGMWPIAWLHGWFTGTDGGKGWFLLITIACLLAAAGAVAWRFTPRFLEIPRPRSALPPTPPMAATPAPGPVPLALRDPTGAHRAVPAMREPTGPHQPVPGPFREPTGAQRPVPGPLREPTGAHRPVPGPFREPTGPQRVVPGRGGLPAANHEDWFR